MPTEIRTIIRPLTLAALTAEVERSRRKYPGNEHMLAAIALAVLS